MRIRLRRSSVKTQGENVVCVDMSGKLKDMVEYYSSMAGETDKERAVRSLVEKRV